MSLSDMHEYYVGKSFSPWFPIITSVKCRCLLLIGLTELPLDKIITSGFPVFHCLQPVSADMAEA